MEIIKTAIPGVLIFEPKRYGDTRGFFAFDIPLCALCGAVMTALSSRITFLAPDTAFCADCIFNTQIHNVNSLPSCMVTSWMWSSMPAAAARALAQRDRGPKRGEWASKYVFHADSHKASSYYRNPQTFSTTLQPAGRDHHTLERSEIGH